MCKHNDHLTSVAGAELDSRRRVGRPNGSRQAIPALPDPTTGVWPSPAGLGKTRLTPPVTR
jgi:hypothetical protein